MSHCQLSSEVGEPSGDSYGGRCELPIRFDIWPESRPLRLHSLSVPHTEDHSNTAENPQKHSPVTLRRIANPLAWLLANSQRESVPEYQQRNMYHTYCFSLVLWNTVRIKYSLSSLTEQIWSTIPLDSAKQCHNVSTTPRLYSSDKPRPNDCEDAQVRMSPRNSHPRFEYPPPKLEDEY